MILPSVPLEVHSNFLEKCISNWGWRIFPLRKIKRNYDNSIVWCDCHLGRKCETCGKHPLIRWAHLEEYPTVESMKRLLALGYTGWGVHLGWSGLVVLDCDPRNGADIAQIMREWSDQNDEMTTMATLTGSGGLHIFLRSNKSIHPLEGFTSPGCRTTTKIEVNPGVELLAGQHFVVLPCSHHKSGLLYFASGTEKLLTFPEYVDGQDGLGSRHGD